MSISKKDLEMMALKRRQKFIDHFKTCADTNHPIPTSRRQFLAAGLFSVASSMTLPSLLGVNKAFAQTSSCSSAVGGLPSAMGGLPSYINLQLAGGPALFANHIACQQAGDPGGTEYKQKLGIGGAATITELFSNRVPFWFGASPSQGESKMIRAMQDVMGVARFNDIINQKCSFIAVAAESTDDRNGVNPQDISGLLQRAGLTGTSLPYLLTGNERNFLNRPGASIRNRFKGAVMDSANFLSVKELKNLTDSVGGYPGTLGQKFSLAEQKTLVASIESLVKMQVAGLGHRFDSNESEIQFRNLSSCAAENNTKALNADSNMDIPGSLAAFWPNQMTAQQTAASVLPDFAEKVTRRAGLVATNTLRGFAGSCAINLGGYDYHMNFLNRNQSNAKDYEFGDVVARILLTANQLGRKLFLHISTDGSLSFAPSADPFVNWRGDSPIRTMSYIIAFDPNGAPPTKGFKMQGYEDANFQLNHFTKEGVVANANPISSLSAQDLCASAIFLNYLAFAKQLAVIDRSDFMAVKKKLSDALPNGAGSIFDYYTRIAG